jgi:hypothetical protein
VIFEEFEKTGGKDHTKIWVMSIMAFLVVAGGIAVMVAVNKTSARKKAEQDRIVAREAAVKEINEFQATRPQDFAGLIALIEEKEKAGVLADDPKTRMMAQNTKAAAHASLEKAKADKENMDALARAEADADNFAKLKDAERELRRILEVAGSMPKEYQERAKALREKLTINKLKASEARLDEAIAKSGTDYEAALVVADQEMTIFRDFFKTYTVKDVKTDPALAVYKSLIKKSDELVDKLVTPEYEDKTATRDLMSPKERGLWGTAPGDGAVSFDFQGRELIVANKPVEGKRLIQILSIEGWSNHAPWYDLVLDFEFEILKGGFELYLRYRPDGYTYYTLGFSSVPSKAGETANYEVGKTYRVQIKIKGSEVKVTEEGNTGEAGQILLPSVSRTGGVGFGLPTGAKVAIKSCTVKVLRPRGGVK